MFIEPLHKPPLDTYVAHKEQNTELVTQDCLCAQVDNIVRAMAVNCPYFPKLAFKKPGKIIQEYITSSSVN